MQAGKRSLLERMHAGCRCCDLAEGAGGLAWESGEELCRWDNYMAPNFTDPAARPQVRRRPPVHASALVMGAHRQCWAAARDSRPLSWALHEV